MTNYTRLQVWHYSSIQNNHVFKFVMLTTPKSLIESILDQSWFDNLNRANTVTRWKSKTTLYKDENEVVKWVWERELIKNDLSVCKLGCKKHCYLRPLINLDTLKTKLIQNSKSHSNNLIYKWHNIKLLNVKYHTLPTKLYDIRVVLHKG